MATEPRSEAPLDDPAVAASEYDTDYYLHSCIGADEWRESGGAEVAGLYPGVLTLAGMERGARVLDIGTGRAELVRVAVEMGAAEAVGVDYSPAAIEMAEETLRAAGNPPGARALLADARRIPVEDGAFDLVTMLDVFEHLTSEELDVSLGEATRALRPGGAIFIHTAPNANVYEITYRLQRRLWPGRGRRWPVDPRNDFERRMHVNEQTMGSLRGVLRRNGFEDARVWLGRWIYTDFVPEERAKRLYHRLARVPLARRFAIMELFARARKPSS